MEKSRLSKIERLLQKELGDMFIRLSPQFRGTIVSISEVRVSADLSVARVYVSIFPTDKVEFTMQTIKNSQKSIRYELGTRIKSQVRIIPEIYFVLDETIDKLENIANILAKDKREHPQGWADEQPKDEDADTPEAE